MFWFIRSLCCCLTFPSFLVLCVCVSPVATVTAAFGTTQQAAPPARGNAGKEALVRHRPTRHIPSVCWLTGPETGTAGGSTPSRPTTGGLSASSTPPTTGRTSSTTTADATTSPPSATTSCGTLRPTRTRCPTFTTRPAQTSRLSCMKILWRTTHARGRRVRDRTIPAPHTMRCISMSTPVNSTYRIMSTHKVMKAKATNQNHN